MKNYCVEKAKAKKNILFYLHFGTDIQSQNENILIAITNDFEQFRQIWTEINREKPIKNIGNKIQFKKNIFSIYSHSFSSTKPTSISYNYDSNRGRTFCVPNFTVLFRFHGATFWAV